MGIFPMIFIQTLDIYYLAHSKLFNQNRLTDQPQNFIHFLSQLVVICVPISIR